MATKRTRRCAAGKRKQRVCVERTGDPGPSITGPQSVCDLLKEAQSAGQESFYAVHLDTQNRPVAIEEVHKGTLAGVEVHPREIFKSAIVSNSHALILVHNHPSGSNKVSREDLDLTERLNAAGRLVGIPVLDHVVIGDGCNSIREAAPQLFGLEGYEHDE